MKTILFVCAVVSLFTAAHIAINGESAEEAIYFMGLGCCNLILAIINT